MRTPSSAMLVQMLFVIGAVGTGAIGALVAWLGPGRAPTEKPTDKPTEKPTEKPTDKPTETADEPEARDGDR